MVSVDWYRPCGHRQVLCVQDAFLARMSACKALARSRQMTAAPRWALSRARRGWQPPGRAAGALHNLIA